MHRGRKREKKRTRASEKLSRTKTKRRKPLKLQTQLIRTRMCTCINLLYAVRLNEGRVKSAQASYFFFLLNYVSVCSWVYVCVCVPYFCFAYLFRILVFYLLATSVYSFDFVSPSAFVSSALMPNSFCLCVEYCSFIFIFSQTNISAYFERKYQPNNVNLKPCTIFIIIHKISH